MKRPLCAQLMLMLMLRKLEKFKARFLKLFCMHFLPCGKRLGILKKSALTMEESLQSALAGETSPTYSPYCSGIVEDKGINLACCCRRRPITHNRFKEEPPSKQSQMAS